MNRTAARALSGIYIALNHTLNPQQRALANDILLQLADQAPDPEIAVLYRSIVETISDDEERDPLPTRPRLRLVDGTRH